VFVLKNTQGIFNEFTFEKMISSDANQQKADYWNSNFLLNK
jgi:hypothetical protein